MAKKPAATPAQGGHESSQPSKAEDGLKEALDQKIGPLVPQQQRGEIVTRVYRMLASENFSGPMPHPKHLREYDEILPGSAERIMLMAEANQKHNIEMERAIVHGEVADRKLGMWFGFAAFATLVALAAGFAVYDKPIVSGLFLSATAIGAISVFVLGRFKK